MKQGHKHTYIHNRKTCSFFFFFSISFLSLQQTKMENKRSFYTKLIPKCLIKKDAYKQTLEKLLGQSKIQPNPTAILIVLSPCSLAAGNVARLRRLNNKK